MKVAVIGGDRRSALLAELLLRDGQRVHSFALEKAALPAEIPRESCLQGCVYGADCVILPVPAEKGALLNTPLSAESLTLETLWVSLWPGQLVIGGGFGEQSAEAALREKVAAVDLLRRPGFVTGNAALTAEAAVGLLLREGEQGLNGQRCLLLGYGRIGKLLAQKLRALGAAVTVAARKEADRALAEAMGCESLAYDALEGRIGDYPYIVNTVPARVLSDAALCCAAPESLLMELASLPGGFDRTLAKNIGLHVVAAPGLPGRCLPLAAAELMRRTVYEIIREQTE